jgi:hypothetical protein
MDFRFPRFATSAAGVFLVGFNLSQALASDWGLTVGYNNPIGATLGGNLIYLGDTFGFEFGVGGLGATSHDGDDKDGKKDDDVSAGLWGDVDVKILFGKTWRPYVEAGFGMALGGATENGGGFSAGAGSPFVGGGILYSGSPLLFYAAGDYKVNSKQIFPVVGLGVKF